MRVVILGGGIIGLSSAYYLLTSSHLPASSTVTLIERTSVAHGASSRAAGIIAEHWHQSHVIPLAELSYKCYQDLNAEYDGHSKWDWRKTSISGVDIGAKTRRSEIRKLPDGKKVDKGWLNGDTYDLTGNGGTATM